MLAVALEAEVADYIDRNQERDEHGRARVVRNGKARPRKVTMGSGRIEVRAPRVDDRRGADDGSRHRFRSQVLPPSPSMKQGASLRQSKQLRCTLAGPMMSGLEVRPERSNDVEAIGDVIRSAFLGMPYADGDEAELVEALRAQGGLSVSLVAELAGEIVGQVAFSPARASGGGPGWYALGPVAVLPAHQRGGIGSTLIRTGLDVVSALGASGCILTGDPAYYSRFGFKLTPKSAPPGEPSEFFMVKLLGGQLPVGPIHFHQAFSGA